MESPTILSDFPHYPTLPGSINGVYVASELQEIRKLWTSKHSSKGGRIPMYMKKDDDT